MLRDSFHGNSLFVATSLGLHPADETGSNQLGNFVVGIRDCMVFNATPKFMPSRKLGCATDVEKTFLRLLRSNTFAVSL